MVGCQPAGHTNPTSTTSTAPEAHSTQSARIPINWNVYGIWVESSGVHSDTVEFSVSGYIENHPAEIVDYVSIKLDFPEDFRYIFQSANPYDHSSLHKFYNVSYFGCAGYSFDKEDESSIMTLYALDPGTEFMLLRWDDGSGRILVASTDPAVKPDEIMEHFRVFIDTHHFD